MAGRTHMHSAQANAGVQAVAAAAAATVQQRHSHNTCASIVPYQMYMEYREPFLHKVWAGVCDLRENDDDNKHEHEQQHTVFDQMLITWFLQYAYHTYTCRALAGFAHHRTDTITGYSWTCAMCACVSQPHYCRSIVSLCVCVRCGALGHWRLYNIHSIGSTRPPGIEQHTARLCGARSCELSTDRNHYYLFRLKSHKSIGWMRSVSTASDQRSFSKQRFVVAVFFSCIDNKNPLIHECVSHRVVAAYWSMAQNEMHQDDLLAYWNWENDRVCVRCVCRTVLQSFSFPFDGLHGSTFFTWIQFHIPNTINNK